MCGGKRRGRPLCTAGSSTGLFGRIPVGGMHKMCFIYLI